MCERSDGLLGDRECEEVIVKSDGLVTVTEGAVWVRV